MALSTIKTLFIKASGREDLNNDTATGQLWFINQGQKMLDELTEFAKSEARSLITLPAGSFVVTLKGCRAITKVYLNDGETITKLERKTHDWLRANYTDIVENGSQLVQGSMTVAGTDSGTPLYYSPFVSHTPEAGKLFSQPTGSHYPYEYLNSGDDWSYKSLLIMPPSDEEVTLEIHGKFYSPQLDLPSDTSFWTEVKSNMLIAAAMYQLELFYRNTEGASDWLTAINREMIGLQKDVAFDDGVDTLIMEG